MRKIIVLIMAIMLFIAGCSDNTLSKAQEESEEKSLVVYCGAGLRKPMDDIAKVYEEKKGVKINYTYAGSAQNLSQIELIKEGDLYMPGALKYIQSAEEKGFVTTKKDVVYHLPVIGVYKGNPANITCLADLAKPGVKVILGDERSAAIGAVAQKILKKNKILEEVEKNVVTKDATVNEVVAHTAMGQGDACIIWEDNVKGVNEIEIVYMQKQNNIVKTVPIGVLSFSKNPELAEDFASFVASEDGKSIFEKHGFKRVD